MYLTLRRGYSPTGSRFIPAAPANAGTPRRRCPRHTMVLAAFSSRSNTSPQDGQTWVRTDRLVATRCVQRLPSGNTPLQSWLVYWAGTATTRLPAYAALLSRMVRNAHHPASLMLLARW